MFICLKPSEKIPNYNSWLFDTKSRLFLLQIVAELGHKNVKKTKENKKLLRWFHAPCPFKTARMGVVAPAFFKAFSTSLGITWHGSQDWAGGLAHHCWIHQRRGFQLSLELIFGGYNLEWFGNGARYKSFTCCPMQGCKTAFISPRLVPAAVNAAIP